MGSIRARELDRNSLKPLTPGKQCTSTDLEHRGSEVAGNTNRGRKTGDITSAANIGPWIEGPWLIKAQGRYYLQDSCPATEHSSYNNGLFVGNSPLGPFEYALYSPFSFKPTGFITGAGHSCTFQAKNGEYWHITTMTISQRDIFERRLGLFPVSICSDGQMSVNTYLGDYPQYVPGHSRDAGQGASPGWMLLSYSKPASASSTLGATAGRKFAVENAFDENVRTWWSAKTGDAGEWIKVDLAHICRIEALQMNFADEGSTQLGEASRGRIQMPR